MEIECQKDGWMSNDDDGSGSGGDLRFQVGFQVEEV